MLDNDSSDCVDGFGAESEVGIGIPIEGGDCVERGACVHIQRESVGEIIGALTANGAALVNAHLAIVIDLLTANNATVESKKDAGDGDELAGGDKADYARITFDESFESV